jgi:RNA polymerase sigma factor (TIGR02999 family)
MRHPATRDVITILRALSAGDGTVHDWLLPLFCMRSYAESPEPICGRERSGHSLQATALINEVFLPLVDIHQVQWRDRVHFLTMTAQLMRRILVHHACRRGYLKQGGGAGPLPLDELALISSGRGAYFVALDGALGSSLNKDAGKAKVVERGFFNGFSAEETAGALDVSTQTLLSDWSLARARLRREVTSAI